MVNHHVKHHYAFTIAALVVAFVGMLAVRSVTGNAVASPSEGFSFGRAFVALIVLVGCLVFFEELRHGK